MADEKKDDGIKPAGPHDPIVTDYRGYEVGKPQTYRDKHNAKRNGVRQEYAIGTNDDPHNW